jgi:GxxExxY protein
MAFLYPELSNTIIKCFYDVYNTLGYGFLEKVYENSLAIELRKQGYEIKQQFPIKVYYETIVVGEYFADLVVENKVILELKAAEAISETHKIQLLNYLKSTKIDVGYILNFGSEPTFKRLVFTGKQSKQNNKKPRKSV